MRDDLMQLAGGAARIFHRRDDLGRHLRKRGNRGGLLDNFHHPSCRVRNGSGHLISLLSETKVPEIFPL